MLIILLAGCSGYEKALKSTDYKLKYKEAFRFYEKGEYSRASALFDQISSVYRGSVQADTVYFYQAMSYYKQNDFLLAGHYFHTFSNTYGASTFAEEADFLRAYCFYLSSPRPSLDQTPTIESIQSFQLFLIKYPDSKRKNKAIEYITELRNKLVEKSYMSAKLYFDLEDYKASIVALNNSLVQFPESKYREDIMYMLVKSSYKLAYNSVSSKQISRYQDAVDEYYSFMAEFPESKYLKEVKKYFEISSRVLGNEDEITRN